MILVNPLQTIPWKGRRFLVSVVLVMFSAVLRIWPLQALASRIPWLTFYPTVMLSALYGGLSSGLVAALLTCVTILWAWPLLVAQAFIRDMADWLGMVVFLLNCTMISLVAEASRRANDRTQEAQKEAEAANRAKSLFLANMSHELRTRLNAVLGYSQLMQRDPSLSSVHAGYLQIINRSGEHLLTLINNILDLSKIEAHRDSLNPVTCNFHNLIDDLWKLFQMKTEAKGLRFDVLGIEDVPRYIVVDETKLRVVLINLLGNALKFTSHGGLTLRFRLQPGQEHEIFLLVEVEDTGMGIAPQEQAQVFKYFTQTESGKKSQHGTGLGLAISRGYVEMMGGSISVVSDVGVGSLFRFSLPFKEGLAQDDQRINPPRQVVGLAESPRIPRILVAEDIDENRSLLVKLLSLIGLEVRAVGNGKEAVEMFERWRPDLIWMDIRMPVMDGLEAARCIKATEAGKQIKIIALSAHVLSEERQAIFDAGCDGFVGKPYREHEIFDAMAKYLRLRYTYAEETASTTEESPVSPNAALELSSVPDDLRVELAEAVADTDALKIVELAERLRGAAPQSAAALRRCAENFDYAPIRLALQRRCHAEENNL